MSQSGGSSNPKNLVRGKSASKKRSELNIQSRGKSPTMSLKMGDIVLNMDLRTVRKNDDDQLQAYSNTGFNNEPKLSELPKNITINKTSDP